MINSAHGNQMMKIACQESKESFADEKVYCNVSKMKKREREREKRKGKMKENKRKRGKREKK